MADIEKRQIEDAKKFAALAREHFAKGVQALEELERALGGGPRQADILKGAERDFDTFWCARYAAGQSGRYVWNYSKDRPSLIRLIRMIGSEELQLRMKRYLANNDAFFTKARHSFGMFVATVNQHTERAEAVDDFDLDPSPVVGCTHTPRCTSDAEHTTRRRALHV